MKEKILVLGGDLRSIKLTQLLVKEGNRVISYGQENSNEIMDNDKIEKGHDLQSSIEKAQIVIAPIPFSSNEDIINMPFSEKKITINDLLKVNKTKLFIAGVISEKDEKKLKENYLDVVDVMKREELAIFNTIATAEGTIQIAIENTDKILQGSKVLILGFGRVAKILADKMSKMAVRVTCCARKISDLAWVEAYGYNSLDFNDMIYYLKDFDIIINTVPQKIIKEEQLKHMNSNALLIDLASYPGGIDGKTAINMGIKFIWALALPGKVAPTTSAEFIKETIYNIIEEKSKNEIKSEEKMEKNSKKL